MGEAIRPGDARSLGPAAPPPKKGSFWIVPVVGVAGILVLLMANTLRDTVPGDVVAEPLPDVIGRWVTSDPRYVDRALDVGAHTVVLEVGPDQPPIRGEILVVSLLEERGRPMMHIEYDAGEGPMILEMVVDGNDRMHLRNQSDVSWTRVR